jgi:NAD(P)-dependent dehydrogenase (short-subunit alcohol dehydrogenase family)
MILIVGGSSGLGKEYVKRCKERGFDFLIISRHFSEEFSDKIWECDLGSLDSIKSVITRLNNEGDKFSSIVFFQRSRHHDSQNQWDEEFAVSVTATREFIKSSDLLLSPQGNRSIVAITSTVTKLVSPNASDSYHVAKSALLQLVKYYARELGPKGIRVNAVSPYTFLKPENREFYLTSKEWMETVKDKIPLRRSCLSDDVLNAIDFFVGNESSYITGQEIVVDGGFSLSAGVN